MNKGCLTSLLYFVLICGFSLASDWPNWRGPRYNGTTDEAGLPDKLDPEQNLIWSTPLPGQASSIPVIIDGRVFLTSTEKTSKDLLALCLNAETGALLWKQKISQADEKIPLNTMASCSPAAGHGRVYFLYADGTATCLDHDGREIWKRNLTEAYGPFSVKFGYSSSPLLYDDKLYILVLRRQTTYRGPDREGLDSFFLALDPVSGQTLFKQQRPTDALDESTNSYATALPAQLGGQMQIVAYGADYLTGHDTQTGKELWRYQYDTTKDRMNRVVTTPLAENGIIYCVSSRGQRTLAFSYNKFIKKEDPLLWEIDDPGPDVACQVLYKDSLYSLDDRGEKTLSCLDPATGMIRWKGRADKSGVYYASLTAADDKIYMINEKGVLSIMAADSSEFKLLSTFDLGQGPVQSSIAISDGKIYIRTAETLYCFGR